MKTEEFNENEIYESATLAGYYETTIRHKNEEMPVRIRQLATSEYPKYYDIAKEQDDVKEICLVTDLPEETVKQFTEFNIEKLMKLSEIINFPGLVSWSGRWKHRLARIMTELVLPAMQQNIATSSRSFPTSPVASGSTGKPPQE